MKYIIVLLLSIFMIGCGMSEEDKQRAHERELARIQAGHYVERGYQGGYQDSYQQHHASSGPSYLETIAIAAAAGYVATKFIPQYQPTHVNKNGVNVYTDKKGRQISKAEYDRRMAQSAKDKAAHQSREKAKLDKWKKNPSNAKKFNDSKKKNWKPVSKNAPKKLTTSKDIKKQKPAQKKSVQKVSNKKFVQVKKTAKPVKKNTYKPKYSKSVKPKKTTKTYKRK